MKKTIIKDIEIRFNDSQSSKVEYIKNIIHNNYNLFLSMLGEFKTISLIPTNEEKVLFLSDFDTAFYEAVEKIFNNDSNKILIANPELLPAFYIEFLVRQTSHNQMSLVHPNLNIDDEMFYSLIAYIYYEKKGSFNDFVEYLKNRRDTDKIYKWLKTEIRFPAYNYLLEITIDFLKQNDFSYFENINDIVNIMLRQAMNNYDTDKNEEEPTLPSLNIQEFEILFYEFLESINAPDSWKQMYGDLKSSGRIAFEKQIDNIDNSKCYYDDNDNLRILITNDGTIKSFCSFVHEFVHYVSMSQNQIPPFSLLEFPSIFFEQLSAKFLENKGYNVGVINKVLKERKQNNLEIYTGLFSIFNDILRFIKNGPILRTDKIKFWENHFKAIREAKENLAKLWKENGETIPEDFLKFPVIDIENSVDVECDSLIDGFIQNGLLIINGYQYLLDTFLSETVLKETENEPTLVTRMIQITNELGNANLQNILTAFDMQDIFNQSITR